MHIVDNIDDFSKYFTGSYIARATPKGMEPVYVRAVGDTLVTLRSMDNLSFTVPYKEVMSTYKLTTPRLGCISTAASVVYISMTPDRQYIKGLTHRRISIKAFSELVTDKVLDLPLAFNIYNNKFFDLKELLELMHAGERLGGALSPKMGTHFNPKLQYPMLTYKTHIVGNLESHDVLMLLSKFEHYKDYIAKHLPTTKIFIWNQ